MKRIYFTAVPLQSNFILQSYDVAPVNFKLKETTSRNVHFPITAIIADTMEPTDEASIVAVRQKNEEENRNYDILREEVSSLALSNYCIRDVVIPESQNQDLLLSLFSAMIQEVQSDACYYACMTFGTKTYPVVLFSVLSYAEKVKPNTQVKGVYYREILRQDGKAVKAQTYDVTSLLTLNSLVDQIAASDPDCNSEDLFTMLLAI